MPELHQLGLPAQIDIVNHRRELVEHHNLAGGAGLGKVKNLADCHVRNSVIVENKMNIKVFVVLDFVIDKGKVAGDVIPSQRNKGDFVGLDLAQLEEGIASLEQPALERPQRDLAVGYLRKPPQHKRKEPLGAALVVEARRQLQNARKMQHRVDKEDGQHTDGNDVFNQLEKLGCQLHDKTPERRTQNSALVRQKVQMIALHLAAEHTRGKLLLLRREVNGNLFLIKIDEAEIEKHIERQIVLCGFPKQQIQTIGIPSRKITLSVRMNHIGENKGNAPVLSFIDKMQNDFWFGNKVRVDDAVRNRAHDVEGELVILNEQLLDFDLIFHRFTPQKDYLTNSLILATASPMSSPS